MKPLNSLYSNRAFERHPADIPAIARTQTRTYTCTIKNLSEGGAAVVFDEQVDDLSKLWLSWNQDTEEIMCCVRYLSGTNAGLQFAHKMAEARRQAAPRVSVAPRSNREAAVAFSAYDTPRERRHQPRLLDAGPLALGAFSVGSREPAPVPLWASITG